MANMTDKDIGAMTPEKQAALAMLKERGAPMTTDNLSRALTVIYRGNNTNDTRPNDDFNLEPPAQPSRSTGTKPQAQARSPKIDPSTIKPSEQPTDPLAGQGSAKGGLIGDLLPWLVPIIGAGVAGYQGLNRINKPPLPQGNGIVPSDVPKPSGGMSSGTDTRIGPDGIPEMDLTGQGSNNPSPDPGYKRGPTVSGALPSPQAMSMFSDKYTPEAGDALSRQLMLAAESGGLGPQHVDALKALSNIVATGPNEAALDESRAAINALQSLPYVRQQQMMGILRGNDMFSPDFNAYLQPRINKPGDALKGVLKRGTRG